MNKFVIGFVAVVGPKEVELVMRGEQEDYDSYVARWWTDRVGGREKAITFASMAEMLTFVRGAQLAMESLQAEAKVTELAA